MRLNVTPAEIVRSGAGRFMYGAVLLLLSAVVSTHARQMPPAGSMSIGHADTVDTFPAAGAAFFTAQHPQMTPHNDKPSTVGKDAG